VTVPVLWIASEQQGGDYYPALLRADIGAPNDRI
jgi:hypothetical protein